MCTTPTETEKLRRLPWVYAQNAANSFFATLTVFGVPFILFLDALGLPKTQIGFLLSLLPFFSIIAPFSTPWAARRGYKRVAVIAWAARKLSFALILLTPLVLSRLGQPRAVWFVAGVVALFALWRALAESALYPWDREIIPDSVRGKVAGTNNALSSLSGAAAVVLGGAILARSEGMTGYYLVFAIGTAAGLLSVGFASLLPGGAARAAGGTLWRDLREMAGTLSDRNFRLFLAAVACAVVQGAALGFVPLYLKEHVRLPDATVVWLSMGTLLGTVLLAYPWGWAADRYGSRPVQFSALALSATLPVLWFLMPRESVWSVPAAFGIAILAGAAGIGWAAGQARLLMVNLVPVQRSGQYMPVFYVWSGMVGGIASLGGGWLLDRLEPLRGQWLGVPVDQFTPLWGLAIVMLGCTALFIRGITTQDAMPLRRFAGLFLQGNPFMAAHALVRFNLALSEPTRVASTHELAQSQSPLTVAELTQALDDPSFNVRYEAIVSAAHMRPSAALNEALMQVLTDREPDLSIAAAWALARLGARKALPALRETLRQGSPLVAATSARALGTLGDADSGSLILERFVTLQDERLRLPYAAALGSLRMTEAAPALLAFLRSTDNRAARNELSLAVARILGAERHYIRLWRNLRGDPGTACAQTLDDLRGHVRRAQGLPPDWPATLRRVGGEFAAQDVAQGAAGLAEVLERLPTEALPEPLPLVIGECAEGLRVFGAEREDYLMLSLHALRSALRVLGAGSR